MGARYREVGGGPATGLANNWVQMLQSFMSGGSTPGTQMTNAGRTLAKSGSASGLANANTGPGGIQNIINDILSQGAGNIGGHYASALERSQDRARNEIMSRFASIGGGLGSGASQALARYEAESADQIPLGIANLQMQTIAPLLQYINSIAGRGIAQRQGYMEQNPWLQGLQTVAGAIPGIGNVTSLFRNGTPAIPTGLGPDIPNIPIPDISIPAPPSPYPWSNPQ